MLSPVPLSPAEQAALSAEGEEQDRLDLLDNPEFEREMALMGALTLEDQEELMDRIWQQEVIPLLQRQAREANAAALKIAQRNQGQTRRAIDGLGVVTSQIPTSVYSYWANREGAGVWNDDHLEKYLVKHFPQLKVKTERRARSAGFDALPKEERLTERGKSKTLPADRKEAA